MGPKKAILLGIKYVCKASDQKSCQMQQTPVSWTNNLLVLYDAIGKDNDDDDDDDYDDDFVCNIENSDRNDKNQGGQKFSKNIIYFSFS